MPSCHQPCLLSRHSSANRNHRKSPLRLPRLERIRPNKQHAQIAKNLFKIFTEGTRGWNTKPHTVCLICYRARRRRKRPQHTPPAPPPPPTSQAVESDPISQSQVASFNSGNARRRRGRKHAPGRQTIVGRCAPVTLDHHIFTKGEWTRVRLRDHPRVPITISIDTSAKARHRTPIADTGAQSDLWSMTDFLACGFSREDLLPVRVGLSAANRSPISIEGAFLAKLTTKLHNGEVTSCRSMDYVSSSVQTMYLSYDSLLNLGILSKYFHHSRRRTWSRRGTTPETLMPQIPTVKLHHHAPPSCPSPAHHKTTDE